MDWAGAAALVVSVVSLLVFLSRIEEAASSPAILIASGALFAVSTVVFLGWESRCERPLLDFRLFANRGFLLPLCAMMLFFVANFMMNIVGPFYFEGVMGFRPTQVGLVFLVIPVVMVVASPVSGWLYDKRHWRYYGIVGMAVVAAAFFALGILARRWFNVGAMGGLFVLIGLGSALFQSPNNTEIMNALPRAQTAVASSVSAAGRNLAMTLGVAFASVLLPLQLRLAGYGGSVLAAEKRLLAGTIGNVMIASGVICLLSVLVLARNRGAARRIAG